MSKNTYTWQFWLLCLSSLLFFARFSMLIPELPAYLESMGGGELKGWIIFIFTISAGLSRPFSGKLADTIGRVPVIMFGAFVCVVCGIFYPFAGTVWSFLLLRLVHGMSTGFTPTGTSAYVADIAAPEKRGEALGIQGLCANTGAAIGPALGSTLTLYYSIDLMFYVSATSALLSVLILLGLPETVKKKQKFSPKLLLLKKDEVFERRVLFPAIIMVLVVFSFGVVLTIVPDLSVYLRVANKGMFFTCLTISSVAVRFFAGRASDKYGRAVVLSWSSVFIFTAMSLLGFVQTPTQLLACAALFGLAHGTASPAIFAWTIDLGIEKYRGRAMGTVYIALEAGIGSGAILSGYMYGNKIANISKPFFLAATLAAIAFILLMVHHRKKKKQKVATY